MKTSLVSNLKAAGRRTAWLRPFMKSLAVWVIAVLPGACLMPEF